MNGLTLQWRQEEHDRLFHADIYTLDKQRRLTHLVLHLAKYNGKLWNHSALVNDVHHLLSEHEYYAMRALAVDAVIVLMSMANLLSFQVCSLTANVDELPVFLAPQFKPPQLILNVGRLSKGLEDLDHLSEVNIATMFMSSVRNLHDQWVGLYGLCVAQMNDKTLLSEAAHQRWVDVEARNMFYTRILELNPQLNTYRD